jgi:hypothetical protein
MPSHKCRNCGLVNALHDNACRRCGCLIVEASSRSRAGSGPKASSSFLYTLLALAIFCGVGYYLINGFEKSYDEVKTNEVKRLAAQPKVSPAPLLSRAESDQQRAEPYKNAVANSPGLATSQKHNDQVNELMHPKK